MDKGRSYRDLQKECIALRKMGVHTENCGGSGVTRAVLESILRRYRYLPSPEVGEGSPMRYPSLQKGSTQVRRMSRSPRGRSQTLEDVSLRSSGSAPATVPNSRLVPLVPRPIPHHAIAYYGSEGDRLGSGTFATVTVATGSKSTGPVAVKTIIANYSIEKRSIYQIGQLVLDGVPLRLLSHPNIMQLIDLPDPTDGGLVRFVLPLADRDTLYDVIPTLNDGQKLSITYQILCGLSYMHAYSIMHRDIKPDNILIFTRSDGTLEAKISDFGVSKSMFCVSNVNMTGEQFTIPYRAPEIFLELPYGYAADVWAMGCIIYEIYTGKDLITPTDPPEPDVDSDVSSGADSDAEMPYVNINDLVETGYMYSIITLLGNPTPQDKIFEYREKESPVILGYRRLAEEIVSLASSGRPNYHHNVPNRDIEALISSILRYNPTERPTAYELLQKPIFNSIRDRRLEWPTTTCQDVLEVCPPYPSEWVTQPYINHRMFKILAEWLYAVGGVYKCNGRTLQMTMRLIDMYLTKATMTKERLQLLGIAAMAVASSYIESVAPTMGDYAFIIDDMYSQKDLWAMAIDLLLTIDMHIMVDVVHDHFLLNEGMHEGIHAKFGTITQEQRTYAQWISFHLIISKARLTRSPQEIYEDSLTIAIADLESRSIEPDLLARLKGAKPLDGERIKGLDKHSTMKTYTYPAIKELIARFAAREH